MSRPVSSDSSLLHQHCCLFTTCVSNVFTYRVQLVSQSRTSSVCCCRSFEQMSVVMLNIFLHQVTTSPQRHTHTPLLKTKNQNQGSGTLTKDSQFPYFPEIYLSSCFGCGNLPECVCFCCPPDKPSDVF